MGIYFFMKVKMVEQVKIALRKPLLIHGLPGLGLIGKISVEFLIDQLKPIKVLDLLSISNTCRWRSRS
jgi:proteasome assembly chaperone (PAC2) family protein